MSFITRMKLYGARVGKRPGVSVAKRWLKRFLVLGIVGLIFWQILDIGWREVITSLPSQPLFYLLFGVLYLTLPIAETFIYRQVWTVGRWESLKAFLAKLVYNHEVIGYSGEVFLYFWARKRVGKSDREIFRNIRDNSILSSITSNLVAIVLLSVLLYIGTLKLSMLFDEKDRVFLVAGILFMVVLTLLFVQFRRYLFALPAKKAVVIFSIYMTRFLFHHGLLMVMWAVVIPEAPWSVWFTFLALHIVLNRVPFLPSKDLFFLWTGVEMARGFDVTLAPLAGMFLVYSALKKVLNLGLYLLINYYWKDPGLEESKERQTISTFQEGNIDDLPDTGASGDKSATAGDKKNQE